MQRPVGTVLVAVLLLLSGCGVVPARPSPSSWRETARTALKEAVADAGTSRLLLREDRAGHLPGQYAVAAAVHTEEEMSKAVDRVATVQVPDGMDRQAGQVEDLLDATQSAVQDARVALVRGQPAPGLQRHLARLVRALERERGRL